MDQCLLRAVSGLLHDDEADEDNEVDTGEVVDKPPDEADSEAVERPLIHQSMNALMRLTMWPAQVVMWSL